MNLNDYPQLRKALYIAQWVVNLALGIGGIILTAQGSSPQWFIITGAVFNFIWTYTGTVASSNVTSETEIGGPPEDGAIDGYSAAIILIAVLVILIFLAVFGVIGPIK